MTYEIKGFKRFRGHEGEPCASGSLYRGKTKVADWADDTHGGPFSCHFVDKAAEAEFLAFAKGFLATRTDFDDQPFDLPKMEDWYIIDCAVQKMGFEYEESKDLERLAKKGICFKLREGGKTDVYSVTVAYTQPHVDELRAKYGAKLIEIVNETLKMPLVDPETARLAAENARFKKLCATATLFRIRDANTGKNKDMKRSEPYSAKVANLLRTNYGTNLVEIINERFL